MATIPNDIARSQLPLSTRLLAGVVALLVALSIAFVVGRETASRAPARPAAVRPLFVTSLTSATGERRLEVMRAMNRLHGS
jgi:hypothetical protein